MAAAMGTWLGIVLALITSVAWGLGNVLTQRTGKKLGPARGMVWSMVAGGLLALPLAVVLDPRSAPVTGSIVSSVVIAGVAGVVAYVGLFFAFANEALTVTVPLVSSWPVVSVAAALFVYGEKLSGRQAAGTAAVIVGALLVSFVPSAPAIDGARPDPRARRRAILAAVASSLGFGVMVPSMARAAPAVGAFGTTALVYAIAATLVALAMGLVARMSIAPPPRAALPLVLMTGAAETTGFVTVALAARYAPMAIVIPVASLSSALTVLFAWVALRERPHPLAAVGALLACAGVVVLAR